MTAVLDVDVTAPLPELAGPAWVLVRYATEPIGALLLDGGDDLGAAIEVAFGDRIAVAEDPRPRRAEVIATGPPLTAAVCTRDRPAALARCLASLLAQEYRRFRILVVDNAPRDDAVQHIMESVAGQGIPVERIVEPRPGLSRARNAAVAAAPGEILAWLDDDEEADRYWLDGIARALLDHPAADAVAGPVAPADLSTPAQVWCEEFGGLTKGRGYRPAVFTAATENPLFPLPPFGSGANLATRPGALAAIGDFDTALGAGTPARAGEDTLALTRLLRKGGTIVYAPGALTWHHHRTDLDGLRRQLVGYGTGLTAAYTALVLRHPSVLPGLVRLAPRALREVTGGGVRTATIGPDFPRELLRANRRGMLRGPVAYLRGRWRS
jgi:GT2 family glycosyltransferase